MFNIMKIRYLLLVLLLAIKFNITAQSEHLYDISKFDSIDSLLFENSNFMNDDVLNSILNGDNSNRDINDLFLLDSTVYYEFNSDVDSFATERMFFFYDDNFNVMQYILKRRSNQNDEWQNTSKIINVYDEFNRQSQRIRLEWDDNNQWLNQMKSEYYYNSNNDETQQSNYDWDVENEIWVNSFRVEFGYNEQGLENSVVLWSRDFETEMLTRVEKYERWFNNSGSVIEETKFSWDKNNYVWNNMSKLNIYYGPDIQSNDYYSWDSTEWKLYKHYGYRLDSLTGAYNNFILRNDTSWVNTENGEVFYNSSEIIIGQESYRFQEDHDYWFGSYKFEQLVTDDGKSAGRITYDWNFSDEDWEYDSKSESALNEYGISDYNKNMKWNSSENIWNMENSRVYYFRNVSSVNENKSENSNLHIYPNPCNNFLTIEIIGLENANVEYQIYSITGRLIEKGSLVTLESKDLDVCNLKKGFYLLKVKSNQKQYSKTFVKY